MSEPTTGWDYWVVSTPVKAELVPSKIFADLEATEFTETLDGFLQSNIELSLVATIVILDIFITRLSGVSLSQNWSNIYRSKIDCHESCCWSTVQNISCVTATQLMTLVLLTLPLSLAVRAAKHSCTIIVGATRLLLVELHWRSLGWSFDLRKVIKVKAFGLDKVLIMSDDLLMVLNLDPFPPIYFSMLWESYSYRHFHLLKWQAFCLFARVG